MEDWFKSETVIYLDCVINGSSSGSDYTLDAASRNIELDIEFRKLYYGVEADVDEYLKGNSDDIIESFGEKLRLLRTQNDERCGKIGTSADKTTRLEKCMEEIAKWFQNDTLAFLERVLTDDRDDPEYSACTVCKNLDLVVEFQRLFYGNNYRDISDYLIKNGYSVDRIDLLNHLKIKEEQERS